MSDDYGFLLIFQKLLCFDILPVEPLRAMISREAAQGPLTRHSPCHRATRLALLLYERIIATVPIMRASFAFRRLIPSALRRVLYSHFHRRVTLLLRAPYVGETMNGEAPPSTRQTRRPPRRMLRRGISRAADLFDG